MLPEVWDSGKTWNDTTHSLTLYSGFGYAHLIPDPDHPSLVCIVIHDRHGSITQARDDRFDWQSEHD